MEMTFRWFGEKNDSIKLDDIRQIPNVRGIVWTLLDQPVGEVWPESEIAQEVEKIRKKGFHPEVVESLNIHEDIKLGKPSRDDYIEKYIRTMELLSKYGVKVICYNFMPVFDWIRTDLEKPLEDNSTAMHYEHEILSNMTPAELIKNMKDNTTFELPGWEKEKLDIIQELFTEYRSVTKKDLWNNLKYFLDAVIPRAEELDIKLAIHPDDPPWSLFELPRIISDKNDLKKVINLHPSTHNGITFCTGSLGANRENDLEEIAGEFIDKIFFAHIRNIRYLNKTDFVETSHRESDGNIPIVSIIEILQKNNYKYYIRPDHGRQIWNEKCRPGYGLYDRALGIMYLNGIIDHIIKEEKH
ncbi:mannonate dehydratase [Salinicoccus kekensis]|uniref:Mannonate dehydratase n=1 Tax=Salinicoccus kekensis TaxID=714307 RepID=A0A285U6R5_9STAP|nr:mannonate dehydratase [Salinicoccus kekensis]SOC37630.1 mannonate dehydratase [Salinicoccus kekensis]